MLLIPIEIPYGLALVFAGKIAEGVRSIESSMKRFAEWGNKAQVAMGHLVLGEIYLEITLGEKKLSQKQLFANLGFMLRTVPFASRKAKQHLEEAIRMAREYDIPATLVRGLLDLGLLLQKKGRSQESVENIKEALQNRRSRRIARAFWKNFKGTESLYDQGFRIRVTIRRSTGSLTYRMSPSSMTLR